MNRLLASLATALSCAGTVCAQFVMTTNATTDVLMTFSPLDGSLVNPSLFPIPNTTQVSAIDVNGEVWISEQNDNHITRHDVAGNLLGTIGPTFPGGGLSNIRGMALVGGVVYVTNAGTANGAPGNAIQMFDTAGNFLSWFTTSTLAASPFSVLSFQGDLLVAGSSNYQDVYRFTLAGVPVATFHNSASVDFAHQLALASDGNVWCGAFTSGTVVKLDAATGGVITSFPAASARGVFELANGNVLWTNSAGVHVWSLATQSSTTVVAGNCYHLNRYGTGTASTATYGAGCDGLAMGTFGQPVLGNASFALRVQNVPAISPLALVAFGTTAINPGFDLTAAGMPGCFGYTSLDIGLFTGGVVTAGTSSFALPIPNNPGLVGFALASQGVSFSLLTPLGLAASNGVQLVLGY